MAKAEFLKERAEDFLKDANFAISEKRWNSAIFHLEQASQLYLKYFLFKKVADFPKTHSLRELLKDLGKAYSKEKEIQKLVKKYDQEISDLEEGYITSRYLPVFFTERQVKNCLKFFNSLISFLKKL